MPCTKPKTVIVCTDFRTGKQFTLIGSFDGENLWYKAHKISTDLNGLRFKKFSKKDGCYLYGYPDRIYIVPCGKCPDCLKAKKLAWTTRLIAENRSNQDKGMQGYFLTLTYQDSCCPSSVSKPDLQKFIKRFRFHLDEVGLRYFAVGEYGDHFGRPHYHVCFWSSSPASDIADSIRKSWKFGFYKVEPVRSDSAFAYTAGYCLKKEINGKKGFFLCSKSLGADIDLDFYKSNHCLFYRNGKAYYPSRYYLSSKKVGLRDKPELAVPENLKKPSPYADLTRQALSMGLSFREYLDNLEMQTRKKLKNDNFNKRR